MRFVRHPVRVDDFLAADSLFSQIRMELADVAAQAVRKIAETREILQRTDVLLIVELFRFGWA